MFDSNGDVVEKAKALTTLHCGDTLHKDSTQHSTTAALGTTATLSRQQRLAHNAASRQHSAPHTSPHVTTARCTSTLHATAISWEVMGAMGKLHLCIQVLLLLRGATLSDTAEPQDAN